VMPSSHLFSDPCAPNHDPWLDSFSVNHDGWAFVCPVTRVTRWACENFAQTVAQPIFRLN
jgi:hypothetical protein